MMGDGKGQGEGARLGLKGKFRSGVEITGLA